MEPHEGGTEGSERSLFHRLHEETLETNSRCWFLFTTRVYSKPFLKLGKNHCDEIGDIHSHEETTHYTGYLPVPDEGQEYEVGTHHDR